MPPRLGWGRHGPLFRWMMGDIGGLWVEDVVPPTWRLMRPCGRSHDHGQSIGVLDIGACLSSAKDVMGPLSSPILTISALWESERAGLFLLTS